MNMLTAVIYNQFRGYFLVSMVTPIQLIYPRYIYFVIICVWVYNSDCIYLFIYLYVFYSQNSIQSSFFRKRLGVRAAFEVLQRRRIMFPFQSNLPAFR